MSFTRKVFVPSNDSFARWLNIVSHNGNSPKMVTFVIASQLHSDTKTKIVKTSDGDRVAAISDNWVNTFRDWTGTKSSEPRLAHVLQGPGAPVQLAGISFTNGNAFPYWGYSFTLQPGQTGIIMHFGVGTPTNPSAQTKAAELVGLPPNALQFMTQVEKNEVLNFVVAPAPPAQVPEGDPLVLVGTGLAGLAGYAGLRWRARRAR